MILDKAYIVKTIPFIVTPEAPLSPSPIADNGDTLLKEYQNGTISQAQFYTELKSRGWTDEQVRQALAVIGKLPHQMGIVGPDNVLSFSQANSSGISENNTPSKTSVAKIEPTPPEIKPDTNASKVKPEHSLQNNSSLITQQNTSTIQITQDNSTVQPSQNNSLWNGVIIGLTISAIVIMSGVVIFVKTQRGKGNAR